MPFNQVESSISMQNLKPRIDNIKLRYGDDKEKVQRETSILYEEAGVDPTAGEFPAKASDWQFVLSNVIQSVELSQTSGCLESWYQHL